jgi:hypothetical protein
MGFERFGDLRVQLLPSAAQQAGVSRVLHQRVPEGINRVGRRASLNTSWEVTSRPRAVCSSSSGRRDTWFSLRLDELRITEPGGLCLIIEQAAIGCVGHILDAGNH